MAEDRIRLDDLDQSKSFEHDEYKKQIHLLNNQPRLRERKNSVALVFERLDAADKGGAINGVVERIDPCFVRLYSKSADRTI